MPWHLPADLAHFKRITLGKPVLMGRKTFESIGRPLPGRRNLVVSRQSDWQAAGAEHAASLQAALALLADEAEIIIMGGAEIYAQAMPVATDLRITEVALTVAGDAFFPPISPQQWQEVARSRQRSARDDIGVDFVHYRRWPSGSTDAAPTA